MKNHRETFLPRKLKSIWHYLFSKHVQFALLSLQQ